jgi:hypothetical protein
MSMTDHRPRREKISTRIEVAALSTIERVAAEQRTTPAQVARVWLEDAARSRPPTRRSTAAGGERVEVDQDIPTVARRPGRPRSIPCRGGAAAREGGRS